MSNGESIVVESSEVLSEAEVTNIVEGVPETPSEPVLPSDEQQFQMPEKFAGKSAEEIAKSYMELEKFKGGDEEVSQEEVPNKEEAPSEDPTKEATEMTEDVYDKYIDKDEVTEADYLELEKLGFNKEQVNEEIAERDELREFQEYKSNKTLNNILEPLGGGVDKLKEVSDWANSSKTPEEVAEFNEALSKIPKVAQQAMLKTLYAEYEASNDTMDQVLHTNNNQTQPSKGYKTQEEFFKDVGSEEYKTNPAYRQAVEKKMSQSRDDLFN